MTSSGSPTLRDTRRVVLLVFPDFHILDLAGPLSILQCASSKLQERGRAGAYEALIAAERPGPVRALGGVGVAASHGYKSRYGSIDTLIVVGGDGVAAAARDRALLAFVQKTAARARRVVSVCTGAFVLGAAGLLSDRSATTHWAHTGQLARSFPSARVAEDAIFTVDPPVYTSAGITAGMDLALHLVEADFGRELALAVARHLVMPVQRAGGQSQFGAQLRAQTADREALRAVQGFIVEHVEGDLSVPALARRAAMSPRHFARVFREQVGVTPAAYVERARLDVACRLLEQTRRGNDEIATAAGFGGARTLRRVFARQLGVTPEQYRARTSTRQKAARARSAAALRSSQ